MDTRNRGCLARRRHMPNLWWDQFWNERDWIMSVNPRPFFQSSEWTEHAVSYVRAAAFLACDTHRGHRAIGTKALAIALPKMWKHLPVDLRREAYALLRNHDAPDLLREADLALAQSD